MPQDIIQDIGATVKSKVDQIGHKRKLPSELQSRICEDILNGSEGIFLWATLMVEEMKLGEASEDAIRKRLRNLPRGILELYDQILGNMLSDEANVKKVMLWILGAIRPLKLSELNVAFAIRKGAESWISIKSNLSFDVKGDIRRYCGQLVRISNDTVELIHRSLEDFLTCDIATFGNAAKLVNQPRFRIFHADAHRCISEACIAYLLLDEFGDAIPIMAGVSERESRIRACLEDYKFLAYSAQYWMQHWRLSPHEEDGVSIKNLTNEGSPKLDTWIAVNWYLKHPMENPPGNLTPLHLASYLHIPFLLDTNLGNKTFIRSLDSNQLTPLDWARKYGQDGEVEKLLRVDTSSKAITTIHDMKGKLKDMQGRLHKTTEQLQTARSTPGETVDISTEQPMTAPLGALRTALENLRKKRLQMASKIASVRGASHLDVIGGQ
jgi:hypothetical protein